MRDPKRIPEVLSAIEAYWTKNPDMRLAQVIGNVHSVVRPGAIDPYYMEDDIFLQGLATLQEISERSRKHDDNSNSGNSER